MDRQFVVKKVARPYVEPKLVRTTRLGDVTAGVSGAVG
jgi:hypothetical protein